MLHIAVCSHVPCGLFTCTLRAPQNQNKLFAQRDAHREPFVCSLRIVRMHFVIMWRRRSEMWQKCVQHRFGNQQKCIWQHDNGRMLCRGGVRMTSVTERARPPSALGSRTYPHGADGSEGAVMGCNTVAHEHAHSRTGRGNRANTMRPCTPVSKRNLQAVLPSRNPLRS